MDEIFSQIFQVGFFAALIRIATPLVFATLGELFAERAGILNLGIEGIMMLAAMTGFSAAYFSGNLWLGVMAAMATGVTGRPAHGPADGQPGLEPACVGHRRHPAVLGAVLLLLPPHFRPALLHSQNHGLSSHWPSPGCPRFPLSGRCCFDHFALVYIAFALVPAAAWVLFRTPWGLNLRTVGENPHAAYSAGVSVIAVRYQALVLSGALMGLAGAFLSMAQYNAYTFGVISGPGLGVHRPGGLRPVEPMEKCGRRAAVRLHRCPAAAASGSSAINLPYQVFLMMPFVLTIVGMALVSRNAKAPAALLIPFRKEER